MRMRVRESRKQAQNLARTHTYNPTEYIYLLLSGERRMSDFGTNYKFMYDKCTPWILKTYRKSIPYYEKVKCPERVTLTVCLVSF